MQDKDRVAAIEKACRAAAKTHGPASDDTLATRIASVVAAAEVALAVVVQPSPGWFDAGQARALRWVTGEEVPAGVARYLLHRQARTRVNVNVAFPALDPRVAETLPLIDRASSGPFVQALLAAWTGRGAPANEAWVLALVAALGDDSAVAPLRRLLETLDKAVRRALALRVIDALAHLGSDMALAALDELARHTSRTFLSAAAQRVLGDIAVRLGLSVDELGDHVVPRLGLDAHSRRVFAYGGPRGRRFTACLGADRVLRLTDVHGKKLTSLPRAGSHDDPACAAEALAAWRLLTSGLKATLAFQTDRLEEAMIARRSWPVARWRALFLEHPVLRTLSVSLVWGIVAMDGIDRYDLLFRPLDDGTLTTLDDALVELPDAHMVRLAHPVDLDDETCVRWQEHLVDYEVSLPFPQLGRPVFRVEATEVGKWWWEGCAGLSVPNATFTRRSQALGWRWSRTWFAWGTGGADDVVKVYPAAGEPAAGDPASDIIAVLRTGGLPEWHDRFATDRATTFRCLGFMPVPVVPPYNAPGPIWDEDYLLPLGEVPPIIFSEAAASVQALAVGMGRKRA
jgi:Domain of unknown function (DUF4132)